MLEKAVSKYPCDIILFGTLGDLSCRKLLPALYQLEYAQLLHQDTRVIGCAREDLTQFAFLDLLQSKVQSFLSEPIDETVWLRFIAKVTYRQLDLTQFDDYQKLAEYANPAERIVISYFAIPAFLYAQVCLGISQVGLNKQPARVVLEKPIGHDLASSKEINNQVAHFYSEDQIYRIDHYLGKETVLNLLVLRFANLIFSSNWDNQFIDKVKITVAEEIGVEGRWNYYDQSGQVRDMLQNHLLQILSLVAMEPPLDLSAESIRSEKLKVLKSLRMISKANIQDHAVRAQYAGNVIKGKIIPGYLEEKGANQGSKTETFVAIKAYIDNWRWSGVPFYLLTGKRLEKKQSEVVIYFKSQPHNIFAHIKKELSPNQLIIRLQPDEGLGVKIINKTPGLGERMELRESKLDLNFNHLSHALRSPDAYERLLLEIMLGNQYLFVSRDEIEQAWTWIDSIKTAWEVEQSPLYTYESGAWGPVEALRLLSEEEYAGDEQNAIS
ncbi:glucose-6-phosphate 1-dehydrogenase [Legionella antarctica]|uniref:Glucose-6-phosphate 1-dehydrogenase n=1 Tax=Legionella antarctica TaxID=2708020 RepID=A0A6F8T1R5_9GAMM|nr:glucose-6-phosphate dehydrogenase [Legionella antarctica]BCA94100.1 glucose-6-phosphate 1-dehydrogenase [Legionella antarctica]